MSHLALAIALLMTTPSVAISQSPQFRWTSLSNGVSLRYLESGDTLASPVVFLHGMLDSWQSWQRVLPALPARLHVLALDLRGHGSSDRPRSYRVTDFADDVVRLLELRDFRNVTLVGHSMGSFIAREVARRAGNRVGALVLIGSSGKIVNPGVRELQLMLDDVGDNVTPSLVEEFQRGTISRPVPEGFFADVMEASLRVSPPIWRAVLRDLALFDDRARLGSIRVPTLILWGELDSMFSRADQEDLLNGIRGSRLVSYQGVGHAPHWEVPGQVLLDLLAFLSEDHELR